MPQIIDIPEVGKVSFPDGMNDADIVSAIKKLTPKKAESGAENTAKQTGFGEAFLTGAGKKTNDILNGMTQLFLKLRGEDKALSGLEQNVQADNALYAPLQRERPFATGLGEALPAMAVPGAGAGYGGAALAGALPEMLSYGSAKDRSIRGGVGAAGGMAGRAAGNAITTFLKPAGAGVSADKAAMQAAERIGFKPLAGQATQNPAILNVENYLSRSAGSSGTMQGIAQAQREALNAAAAKSVGQGGNEVSAELLNAAQQQIGGEFNRLQEVTAPNIGERFVNALAKIESDNAAKGPFRNAQVDKLIEKGLDLAAKGDLSGQAYKEIRTELTSQANSAFKSEGGATLGQALKTVRSALDDAAEQSLSTADQSAWKAARDQWANWKVLTKGGVSEAGDVSAARVAQQLRARGPGFRTGQVEGPLADIARIGEGFKGPLNPNSGNLQHTAWGVAAMPVNFGAAQVYTSPLVQKWLRDGILDIGKNGELIVKATGVPVGVDALKAYLGANQSLSNKIGFNQ